MEDVDLFSQADLERFAKREVERAVTADREIQKHKVKQIKAQSAKPSERYFAIAATVVLVTLTSWIGYNYADDEPQSPPSPPPLYEVVDSGRCVTLNDHTYYFESVDLRTNIFCASTHLEQDDERSSE